MALPASQLIEAGQIRQALEALAGHLRNHPTDVAARTSMFEALCFAGELDRAEKHLNLLADTSEQAKLGAILYFSAIHAERQRITALPFDKALAEFKAVVEKLEAGNLPLEDSMALFEQGVLLQRRCERMLSEAELRFQRLVESAGGKVRALDLSVGESEEPS